MSLVDDAIASIKAKGQAFSDAYLTLDKMPNIAQYPTLYARWQKLKSEGETVKGAVQSIIGGIESGARVVASALSGTPRDGLGFVQVIAVPLIYATAAGITAYVAAVAILNEDYKKAEMGKAANAALWNNVYAKTGSAAAANGAVQSQNSGDSSSLQKFSDMLPLLLIGGALLIFASKGNK